MLKESFYSYIDKRSIQEIVDQGGDIVIVKFIYFIAITQENRISFTYDIIDDPEDINYEKIVNRLTYSIFDTECESRRLVLDYQQLCFISSVLKNNLISIYNQTIPVLEDKRDRNIRTTLTQVEKRTVLDILFDLNYKNFFELLYICSKKNSKAITNDIGSIYAEIENLEDSCLKKFNRQEFLDYCTIGNYY